MSVTFESTAEQALVALWRNAKDTKFMSDSQQALAALCFKNVRYAGSTSHTEPTLADARRYLRSSYYVFYFFGRRIKTDFSTFPKLESRSYDQVAGEGQMLKVSQLTSTEFPQYDPIPDTIAAHELFLSIYGMDADVSVFGTKS